MQESSEKEISRLQGELSRKGKEQERLEAQINSAQKEIREMRNYEPEEPKEYAHYYNEVIPQLTAALGFSSESIVAKIALSAVGIVMIVITSALTIMS